MEYDDRIIEIHYWRGCMRINPDRFFPCTQKNMKKILELIEQDYMNGDRLLEELRDYFPERLGYEREIGRRQDKRELNGSLRSISAICGRLEKNAGQLEKYMSGR